MTRSKVGRLERMQEFDTASLARYSSFLEHTEKGKLGLDNT